METSNSGRRDLPDTKRRDFMVLETREQKDSLYHPIRLEILRALNQGFEDFETETKKTEKQLDDGTTITEEVTIRKPSRRSWMSVSEILATITENRPKLKVSNFNCYYHLKQLLEQGLVEQHPLPRKGERGDSERVRGMFFRTTARFFVPTTFEISPGLAERDVLPPEVEKKAVELAQQVKETGRADAYEYRLEIGGSVYWFSVTMSLHDDGESIVSIVRDITAQKNTEEELRRSRERLELALRGADLVSWDWQHSTGRMTFDDRCTEMLGYTPEELDTFADKWEALIHPDDLGLVLDKWGEHLANKTQMFSEEHRMMTKQGRIIWVLNRGRVVERAEDGSPLRSAGTLLDVTHEKLELEALDRSEERYRRLFDESLQGIVIFVRGRIVFANRAYARTVGRTLGELLEMSPEESWNMVHPDDKDKLDRHLSLIRNTERSWSITSGEESPPRVRFRYVRPNGEVRWVDSYVNVVEHDGEQAMQALDVDITEQYIAENALRESEKRFRGIFEFSPVGILVFDVEGRIIQINEAAKRIIGVSKPSDYASYRLDRDPNIPESVLVDIQEGVVSSFQVLYDLKKGGLKSSKTGSIYLQVIGSAFNVLEDGTASTTIAQIIDITEGRSSLEVLEESEKKYRLLFDASDQAVVLFEENLVVDCNRAALELFDCKKDQLLGKSHWQISPRNQTTKLSSREMSQRLMSEVLSGKSQDVRWRFKRSDGTILESQLKLDRFSINGISYVRGVIQRTNYPS
jgi:PAS domain S-box-containing protein